MLLYTRVAPPKAPKRRSRSGCTFCKEKKKKCDEARPQCARCAERGQECAYEVVKPRQRKKRGSSAGLGADTYSQTSGRTFKSSDGGLKHWRDFDKESRDHSDDSSIVEENDIASPVGSSFDAASLFAYNAAAAAPDDDPLVSPIDSVVFDRSWRQNDRAEEVEAEEEADEEETEEHEVIRRHSVPELAVARPQSRQSDLARIAPVSTGSPRLEFLLPAFAEFSDRPNRRALVDHFCNVLSHLIVFREESGNPFQQLVLPLCHKSNAVTNAIYALASAHLEYRECGNAEKSVYFHNQAILELARLIELGGDADKNELLGAIMLLVYYEVLVQRGRSNIVDGHLKGAMTIMNSSKESSDPTGIFLERAFRFYDVIAALSFGTAPLSSTPAAGGLLPFPPLDAPLASPLCNVDTLLGMATTLWPIIHRLSTLPALKAEIEEAVARGELTKVAVLRTEYETTAEAIEVALTQWQPSHPPGFSFDGDDGEHGEMAVERGRIQSILNNALAYRHSAFVYLYRTIYGYSRRHALVQRHAHVALTHCVATVSHAGPMGALLWPLFVAACEAISLGDRDLARQAFVCVERRQGMTNISRAWTIAQEVWRRADVMEENAGAAAGFRMDASVRRNSKAGRLENGVDLWRRVSEDMGVNVVFG